MALVTVQRSPSPTNTPDSEETGEGGDEVDDPNLKSPGRQRRSKSTLKRLRKFFHTVRFISKLRPCFSESYFAVKGAALILPQSDSECTYSITKKISRNSNEGDIQTHLQSMFYLLRPQDTIKVAVKLESLNSERNRYMAVVSTNGKQDTEESVILGIDCDEKATIGLVVPIYSNTSIKLDGDGGFQIIADGCPHGFKPVSVQAMWSALQSLNKVLKIATDNKYLVRGLTHTWVGYYNSKINSDRAYVTEWNTNEDREFFRSVPIVLETDDEEAALKKKIRVELKNVMMKVDLDDVTPRFLRQSVEEAMEQDLKEYKGYIDQEMLQILGQMDSPTLIKDFLYLGSEWNASNMEELQQNGVGYILNISKEIDNFFPGAFRYMNVREWDSEQSDILPYWEDTYKFIVEARSNNSKVLVHCKMGISRSASTVIAFCMKEYDMSRQEAYEYVRNLRSCIMPNSAFWSQLETYEGILTASNQRRIFKVRSEQNMQKSQQGQKSESNIPEEAGDFLGYNLPLFEYHHMCHTSDLEESVFFPEKRSEDDGNNETCPLEPDFENASRSADSTEELLPDNLSPTPDTASGLIKTASGIYYFKDPIVESDDSGDEGACKDNKNIGSETLSDKHLLDPDSLKGSSSIEVPSITVPKIKPDSSWIRESSTDDLDPAEMEILTDVPEVDITDAQTDENDGMIFFKADPSEQSSSDGMEIAGSISLQDATVTESSTDGDQPEIHQYVKEDIPWNPGKVKKQKQHLEGKLSVEGSEGVVLLVEGVPYVDNDKQNANDSDDLLSDDKDCVKDDKVCDKKEQGKESLSPELVSDGQESSLKRPASVYEIEDIQLPEGIVKRTTQEIEDRNRSTDDLTRSPKKPLQRSSSFKDQRVTPKNKRFNERRKTCTPILSPTTPSCESSPTKDISTSDLESSFLRDTTPQQSTQETVECHDNKDTQNICDNKDSDKIRDNLDLESPSTDVEVYKLMGEEVPVEKGIVKKQKMDIEQKNRERTESESKETGTASMTTSDTKTPCSQTENAHSETNSALQYEQGIPQSGTDNSDSSKTSQLNKIDSVMADNKQKQKVESVKCDAPFKSDSHHVSVKTSEKSGENLESPSGEYSGQLTPHISRKKRKSESEKTGRFDAETLELIREIGSALLNSPAKSEVDDEEQENQDGGGLVRRFVKDIEKRTKIVHKRPTREVIIVDKDSQKKKQWRFSTPETHDSSTISTHPSAISKSSTDSVPKHSMSHSVSTPAINLTNKSPLEHKHPSNTLQDQKRKVPENISDTGLPPLEKNSPSKKPDSHFVDTHSPQAVISPSLEKVKSDLLVEEESSKDEELKGVKTLVGKFESSDKPSSTKYSVLSPSEENRNILDISVNENIEIISASPTVDSQNDKNPKLSPTDPHTGHQHPQTGHQHPHTGHQHPHTGHQHPHTGHQYSYQHPQSSDDQGSWEDITSDSSTEGTAHLRHLRQNLRKTTGTRPKSAEHLHSRSNTSPGYHRYFGSDLRKYKFQHSRTVSEYSDSTSSFTWEGKKIRKLHGKSHPLTKLESKRKNPFYNTM